MIPDLGKYAATVLSAYGISLVLLIGIVILSVVQARAMKRRLEAAETRARAARRPRAAKPPRRPSGEANHG